MTIYCNYEPARRPRDEFFEDPEHGTVHFQHVNELHTTTGELIKVQQIPGVAIRIDDALRHDIVEKIPGVGVTMKERFGAETVEDLRKLE
jgi:hypothetical protein